MSSISPLMCSAPALAVQEPQHRIEELSCCWDSAQALLVCACKTVAEGGRVGKETALCSSCTQAGLVTLGGQSSGVCLLGFQRSCNVGVLEAPLQVHGGRIQLHHVDKVPAPGTSSVLCLTSSQDLSKA